jgi:hypothetical protein
MKRLKNEKHEQFCQNLIKHDGQDCKKIMEESGFKDSPAYYSHLKNKPDIKARILKLRQEAGDNENILCLQKRLEMLSVIAGDPTNLATVRIRALAELHKQCGDDINQVSMDLSTEASSIIQFVEVELPKQKKDKDTVITGNELDDLDSFLNDLPKVVQHIVKKDTNCPF